MQDNNKERQAGMVRNNMTLEDSISFQLYTEIIEIFARNYFSYVFNAKRFMQALSDNIAKYEQQFGALDEPVTGMPPMNFGTPNTMA